jgi:DHA2 family multidrug resistance protein-like MFS transporter
MACHDTPVTKWIAAGGGLVASLDSTVNIALPAMAATFGLAPERMQWVLLCYLFTYAVVAFAGGALGDRFGHGRVFRTGLALNALTCAWCAVAPSFGTFLVARVALGVSSGLVYGTVPGLVTLAARPEARGRALGFLNAGIAVGFVAGPLVAAAVLTRFGWPAVFHVRVPLAAGLFAWALVSLPAAGMPTAAPLVRLRDLARGDVLRPGAISFLGNAGIFAVWLLAPFYLVQRRALSASIGGLFLMLTPLGTAVAAPVAGRASDRMGPWTPVALGLALEAAGLGLMSGAGPATPLVVVALALFLAGFGVGAFTVPNMAALMAAFPGTQQGAAGGFSFLARTLGVVTGVTALAAVFGRVRVAVGFDAAFGRAFLLAAAIVAAAVLVALARKRRR